MEWLNCCLWYFSLWHHNAATIASVTPQGGTDWDALSNQNAAVLVQPISSNPHDINRIKMEFLIDEIIIFTSSKQHVGKTVKFNMHDKSENICCCGIWQRTTLGWCYSIALELSPIFAVMVGDCTSFIEKNPGLMDRWIMRIYYNSWYHKKPTTIMQCGIADFQTICPLFELSAPFSVSHLIHLLHRS